jgi:hypothetical protein
MNDIHPCVADPGPVFVLLHPNAVPVVDIFRCISRFEDRYDLAILDGPEEALLGLTRPDAAKAIVSDALLLAFALDRQRSRKLCHAPLKSRRGSMDEYCLLALIGASCVPDSELAFEASAALGIASLDLVTSLASDLVRQIDLAGLALGAPAIDEFRGVVGNRILFDDDPDLVPNRPEFKFRF